MNPFVSDSVLTLFSVNQPLEVVSEAIWFDSRDRKRDISEIPREYTEVFGLELLGLDGSYQRQIRRMKVNFDLGWGYRGRPNRRSSLSALYWSPINSPSHTAILSNCIWGDPHLLTNSTPYQDWEVLWTCVDDADPESSVYWFQFTGPKESVFREVWCGYDDDDEENARWRFHESGPIQPFEDAANYQKKRIKDRLTRTMIGEYFARFGSDIRSTDFWNSSVPAWVFWCDVDGSDPRPPYVPEETRHEQ